MGKKSRTKGYVGEKEMRDLAKLHGLDCVWQAEDPKKADLRLEGMDAEIKYGDHVPLTIYKWLAEKMADILIVRKVSRRHSGYSWIVIMRFDLFLKLLKGRKKNVL